MAQPIMFCQSGSELDSGSKSNDVDLVVTLVERVSAPGAAAKLVEALRDDEPSGIHELAEVPSTIIGQDDLDLRWYFKTGGLDMFSGSTFGSQLDRAAMFARRIKRCSKCKGCGFAPRGPKSKRATTTYEQAWMAFKRRKIRLELVVADEQCRKCLGMGYVEMQRRQSRRGKQTEVSAQPTGGSKKGRSEPAVLVSDSEVAQLGRVTSRLERVMDRSAISALTLAAYYSPEWSPLPDDPEKSEEERRRRKKRDSIVGLFGVWPLTAAGKTLLRRSRKDLRDLHVLAALHNEVAAQETDPKPNRRALLDACRSQASELYAVACRAWNVEARDSPLAQFAVRCVVSGEYCRHGFEAGRCLAPACEYYPLPGVIG